MIKMDVIKTSIELQKMPKTRILMIGAAMLLPFVGLYLFEFPGAVVGVMIGYAALTALSPEIEPHEQ